MEKSFIVVDTGRVVKLSDECRTEVVEDEGVGGRERRRGLKYLG